MCVCVCVCVRALGVEREWGEMKVTSICFCSNCSLSTEIILLKVIISKRFLLENFY